MNGPHLEGSQQRRKFYVKFHGSGDNGGQNTPVVPNESFRSRSQVSFIDRQKVLISILKKVNNPFGGRRKAFFVFYLLCPNLFQLKLVFVLFLSLCVADSALLGRSICRTGSKPGHLNELTEEGQKQDRSRTEAGQQQDRSSQISYVGASLAGWDVRGHVGTRIGHCDMPCCERCWHPPLRWFRYLDAEQLASSGLKGPDRLVPAPRHSIVFLLATHKLHDQATQGKQGGASVTVLQLRHLRYLRFLRAWERNVLCVVHWQPSRSLCVLFHRFWIFCERSLPFVVLTQTADFLLFIEIFYLVERDRKR